jgi:hypothetical protein
MATQESTPRSVAEERTPEQDPEYDPWVRNVVEDPMAVPAVVVIYGFVGKAARDDHVRIYLTASLTYLCEIPRAAIVHHMPLPRAQFPLGGSYFWITADAWTRSMIHWVPVQPPSFSQTGQS